MPGLHDDNEARAVAITRVVGEADSVWVVSRITRACNDKTARSLLPAPLRDALMGVGEGGGDGGGGYLGALCVVASQADLLTPSEIQANLGLPAGSSARACAVCLSHSLSM